MGNWFSLITDPLGNFLSFIYNVTNSYGLSIILFTIVVKIILIPLTYKQQKSTMEMQKIQPIIGKLQKKYKNDNEKLNEEMMKVYQEHKINPAAGCLPMFIQLPIIFALFRVINKPLTYILKITTDEQRLGLLNKLNLSISLDQFANKEILIAEQMQKINIETLRNITGIANISPIDFNFLGLNLAHTPQITQINLLLIIPILAAGTTYLSSKLMTKMNSSSSNKDDKTAQMTNNMMTFMPIMTGFISFTLPAGVGLYWIISNVFQMAQQFILNKYFAATQKEGKVS